MALLAVNPALFGNQFPLSTRSEESTILLNSDDQQLQARWVFWTEPTDQSPASDYLKQLTPSSGTYSKLQGIQDFCLKNGSKYQRILLFKEGIKPFWEDPSNVDGGRFFVHCQSQKQAFEQFLLTIKTVLPGNILDHEDLCGLIYAFKLPNRFSVSIWHKNSKDKIKIKEIRAHLKALFNVKTVSYHNHRASIKLSYSPPPKNDCGMNTFPPKKKSSDSRKFEASLNQLQPRSYSGNRQCNNNTQTKQRSKSYDLVGDFTSNNTRGNPLSLSSPTPQSEFHSRRTSFDKSGELP
jgi:hypothetical protein